LQTKKYFKPQKLKKPECGFASALFFIFYEPLTILTIKFIGCNEICSGT
jgi:hypothetical protein